MINLIKSQNNSSTSFKKLVKNVSLSRNKETANYIETQLNTKYPNDKNCLTILERADKYNLDIYLGEQEGGVSVSIINRKGTRQMQIANLLGFNKLGVYSCSEQFDVKDFLSKYKFHEDSEKFRQKSSREDKIILAIIMAMLISVFAALIHKNDVKTKSIENKIITEMVKNK